MRTKPIKVNIRLTQGEYEFLRSRSQDLFGGNLSQAFVSLIGEVGRGISPPSLETIRGKAKSHVAPGQDSNVTLQG